MPIYRLSKNTTWFPTPSDFAPEEDVIAVGGDVSSTRLVEAYHRGIFPWYNPGEPILWWCPVQRMVLQPHEVHISKSSRNLLNRNAFEVTYDQDFESVIQNCQQIERKDQEGTWISEELKNSFLRLHKMRYAHSVEAWQDGKLMGGLYGITIGKIFLGESMFSKVSNAGKIAFIKLCQNLNNNGYKLVDCQVYNDYLASLGAYEVDRHTFLDAFQRYSSLPSGDDEAFGPNGSFPGKYT